MRRPTEGAGLATSCWRHGRTRSGKGRDFDEAQARTAPHRRRLRAGVSLGRAHGSLLGWYKKLTDGQGGAGGRTIPGEGTRTTLEYAGS